jgi:hypothetical protein
MWGVTYGYDHIFFLDLGIYRSPDGAADPVSWPPWSSDLVPLELFLRELVKDAFHFYLQMLMICGQELEAQSKLLQTGIVTRGNKFIMGGVFVVLHL